MVWDCKKNIEKVSFISMPGDEYMGKFNGLNSKLGYLAFKDYVVNLDIGLPNPFFSLNCWRWASNGY